MDVFFMFYEMLELMVGFYGVFKVECCIEELLVAVGFEDKCNVYVC